MKKINKSFFSFLIAAVISVQGLYPVLEISSGAEPITAKLIEGDINGDGVLNSKDLTRLMKKIAGEEVEVYGADLTGDGKTNAVDLTRLMKIVAGIITTAEPQTDPATETERPPETEPVLEEGEYKITFYMFNNDRYLEGEYNKGKFNNPNPRKYNTGEGLTLNKEISVEGYIFNGWYDGQGSDAKEVTAISKGETGNKAFYAHWEKVEYKIKFVSELVAKDDIIRTVDETTPLDSLSRDNYIFMGWSNKYGKIVNTVEPGTTDITLYANWTSQRNQTRPNNYEEKGPLVFEENGQYMFVYDIGTVINVPLYTIQDYKNASGITISESYTDTHSISKTDAKTVNKILENATTKSLSWTLSSDWNQLITETEGKANTVSKENVIAVSNGSSTTAETTSAEEVGKSGEVALSHDKTTSSKTISTESNSMSAEISGGVTTPTYKTNIKMSGTSGFEDTDEESESESNSQKLSLQKTLNTNTGYKNSTMTSNNTTTTDKIGQSIMENWEYSISKSVGGSNSSTEVSTSLQSATDGYSSSLSFTEESKETIVKEWTNAGAAPGWYRTVCAGTIHVFAVVCYDIASQTYYVYTYSALDDETHEFTDYSMVSTYDDYNNGVLPFKIPIYVEKYVNTALGCSKGLIIDRSKGTINEYEGDAKKVYIPDYKTFPNGDGTSSVVKITGIKSDAFAQNKTVETVLLGKYIDKIPDNAFSGCSALKKVKYNILTSIGNEAFSNCTSLEEFKIETTVTSLGNKALSGVKSAVVDASSIAVAESALSSEVENLTLNLNSVNNISGESVLTIPESIDRVTMNGFGKSFSNISIESHAKTTILNRITLEKNTGIPLKLYSGNIVLNQVIVKDSPGLALVLMNNQSNVALQGTNSFTGKGECAVLSKSLNLSRSTQSSEACLLEIFGGDLYICGTLTGQKYLDSSVMVNDRITPKQFDEMLSNRYIIFDTFGGVPIEKKSVATNSEIGELPVPTREGFTFDGWYNSDGSRFEPTQVFVGGTDITVTARWISGWVEEGAIPQASVISDEKWTYTKTEYKDTANSSEVGWEQFGSYWYKTGSGSTNYASFPGTFDTGNWFYQNYAKGPFGAFDNGTTKREVSNSRSGYIYWHWMYNCGGAGAGNRTIYHMSGTAAYNNYYYYIFGAFASGSEYTDMGTSYNYECVPGRHTYKVYDRTSNADSQGSYYWYRFDYYTSSYTDYQRYYQYKKVTNDIESGVMVSNGGEISNVKRFVRYNVGAGI